MKNKIYWLVAGCAAVIAVVVVVAVGSLKGRMDETVNAPTNTTDQSADLAPDDMTAEAQPLSGDQTDSTDSVRIVQSEAGDYSFAMIPGWYLERNDRSGLTVYPDYNPQNKIAPDCKIEVSELKTANSVDLDSLVTAQVNADPTADVSETSRTATEVSRKPAIEWHGVLNGVTTTLVYVWTPVGGGSSSGGSGKVFEIAPSVLSEANDADNDACGAALQEFLSNVEFLKP